jgi:curved DNA-binding protein CbpA
MYHPDSGATADTAKFTAVLEAFRALRDPAGRAEYDRLYGLQRGQAGVRDVFSEMNIDEETALSDADAQARILLYLYKKKTREHAGCWDGWVLSAAVLRMLPRASRFSRVVFEGQGLYRVFGARHLGLPSMESTM